MQDLPMPIQPLADTLPSPNLGNTRRGLPRSPNALPACDKSVLVVSWTRHQNEMTEAQRLRYKVFAEKMGVRLPSVRTELDVDVLDVVCDHLIVRDQRTLRMVGTYRVLRPDAVKQIGCLYSEFKFDLARLAHLRPKMVGLGRSHVYHDYRSSSVIMALWAGLGEYTQRYGFESALGYTSMSMDDGNHFATSLYRNSVEDGSLAPIEYHAFPRVVLPVGELNQDLEVGLPALVEGYLRLSTHIYGTPAWGPDSNIADFLTLLRLSDINLYYTRHFPRG